MNENEKKVRDLLNLLASEEGSLLDLQDRGAALQREIAQRQELIASYRADLRDASADLLDRLDNLTEDEPVGESYCLLDGGGDWWASYDGEGWGLAIYKSRNVFDTPGYSLGAEKVGIIRLYGAQS